MCCAVTPRLDVVYGIPHFIYARINVDVTVGCSRLSTILLISRNAGALLKPNIPLLVPALLEAVSGLEPDVINYLSLHMGSQAGQDKVKPFIKNYIDLNFQPSEFFLHLLYIHIIFTLIYNTF